MGIVRHGCEWECSDAVTAAAAVATAVPQAESGASVIHPCSVSLSVAGEALAGVSVGRLRTVEVGAEAAALNRTFEARTGGPARPWCLHPLSRLLHARGCAPAECHLLNLKLP